MVVVGLVAIVGRSVWKNGFLTKSKNSVVVVGFCNFCCFFFLILLLFKSKTHVFFHRILDALIFAVQLF